MLTTLVQPSRDGHEVAGAKHRRTEMPEVPLTSGNASTVSVPKPGKIPVTEEGLAEKEEQVVAILAGLAKKRADHLQATNTFTMLCQDAAARQHDMQNMTSSYIGPRTQVDSGPGQPKLSGPSTPAPVTQTAVQEATDPPTKMYTRISPGKRETICVLDGCADKVFAGTKQRALHHLHKYHADSHPETVGILHTWLTGSTKDKRSKDSMPSVKCLCCDMEVRVDSLGRHFIEVHCRTYEWTCNLCGASISKRGNQKKGIGFLDTHHLTCPGKKKDP